MEDIIRSLLILGSSTLIIIKMIPKEITNKDLGIILINMGLVIINIILTLN